MYYSINQPSMIPYDEAHNARAYGSHGTRGGMRVTSMPGNAITIMTRASKVPEIFPNS